MKEWSKRKKVGISILALAMFAVTIYSVLGFVFSDERVTVEITSRTEYIGGDEGQVLADVRFAISNLPAPATCYASALYPDKSVLFSDELMSVGALGAYNYTFVVPDVEGVFEYQTRCELSSRNVTRSKAFHVSGLLAAIEQVVNERVEIISLGVSQARLRETVANTWQLDSPLDLSIGVPICTVGLIEGLTTTVVQGEVFNTPALVSAVVKGFECGASCLGDCVVDDAVPVPVDIRLPLSNKVFNFEEGFGTNVTSFDGYAGSWVNTAGGYSWVNEGPGNLDWSIHTDGVSDKFELGGVGSKYPTSTWFWIRTDSVVGGGIYGGTYYGGSRDYWMRMNANGTIHVHINRTNIGGQGFDNTSTISINDGEWHLIELDYTGPFHVYVDRSLAVYGAVAGAGGIPDAGLGALGHVGSTSNPTVWADFLEADFAQFGQTYITPSNPTTCVECIPLTEEQSDNLFAGELVQDYNVTCDDWDVNATQYTLSTSPYPRTVNSSFDDAYFMVDNPVGGLQTGTSSIIKHFSEFDYPFVFQWDWRCYNNGDPNCRSPNYESYGGSYQAIEFLNAAGDVLGSLTHAGPASTWNVPGSPYPLSWVYRNGTRVNLTSLVGSEGHTRFNLANGTWQIVREDGQIRFLKDGSDSAPTAQRDFNTNPNNFYNELDPLVVISDVDFVGEFVSAIRILSNQGSTVESPYDGVPAQNQVSGKSYDGMVLEVYGLEDNYVVSSGSGVGGPGSNDDKLTYYWYSDPNLFSYGDNYEVECTVPYSFGSGTAGELVEMSQFVYITNEGKLRAFVVK